jgi:hypothetical protein
MIKTLGVFEKIKRKILQERKLRIFFPSYPLFFLAFLSKNKSKKQQYHSFFCFFIGSLPKENFLFGQTFFFYPEIFRCCFLFFSFLLSHSPNKSHVTTEKVSTSNDPRKKKKKNVAHQYNPYRKSFKKNAV